MTNRNKSCWNATSVYFLLCPANLTSRMLAIFPGCTGNSGKSLILIWASLGFVVLFLFQHHLQLVAVWFLHLYEVMFGNTLGYITAFCQSKTSFSQYDSVQFMDDARSLLELSPSQVDFAMTEKPKAVTVYYCWYVLLKVLSYMIASDCFC